MFSPWIVLVAAAPCHAQAEGVPPPSPAGGDSGTALVAAAAPEESLLDRVYFATGSAALTAESMRTLDAVAASLRGNPELHLRVEGHTDARGSRRGNMKLGQRRATAVRTYLVSAGIAAERIQVTSLGSERPLEEGLEPSSLAKNRRVDLVARAG